MKIAILGSGYIGAALIDLYLKTKHEITVFDAVVPFHLLVGREFKFVHSPIQNYKDWNLEKFDIVYNLIGLASTKGTDEELIDEINHKCAVEVAKRSKRYLFASSCNVFGGMTELKYNLTEDDTIFPETPYAKSKALVEKWLEEKHDNYVICRFGANYGYSPAMKYGPVGNIFILNSVTGKEINCGNPTLMKPFCHVRDTVRALFYLAHKNEIKNDTFHVVKHNYNLKDLAEIMFSHNRNLEIKYGEKKIPSGYHISNKKLKDAGFKFMYDFDKAYRELEVLFENVQNI